MNKTIIGISDVNQDALRMRYRNWIEWVLTIRGMGHIKPDWAHPQEHVKAAVSMGRWYVKCPGGSCGICCCIDEKEPLFFCPDCLCIDNDFKPYQVDWPSDGSITRINEIMAERPDYRTRNFLPHHGETEEELKQENAKKLKKSKFKKEK